jgi:hypothetical protein
MEATVVDLRYRMKEVLKALERNEEVSILYHGKIKGTIRPAYIPNLMKVRDHAFFNMSPSERTVEEEMKELRGGRYRDL